MQLLGVAHTDLLCVPPSILFVCLFNIISSFGLLIHFILNYENVIVKLKFLSQKTKPF